LPVTGQPDWGSVQIRYSGPQIDQGRAAALLVSFRNHNEFHDNASSASYMDVWKRCQPIKLAVYARSHAAAAGHQPISHQPPDGAAGERANSAAVAAAAGRFRTGLT